MGRPKGVVMGIKTRTTLTDVWLDPTPPMCQTCWTKRRDRGEARSRLVFRPGCLLTCTDCAAVVSDDRRKKAA